MYRIRGLADVSLIVPRRFRRELAAAPAYLDPDEEVEGIFEASRGLSTAGGLLFVTDKRVLFLICKWLKRQPSVWAIAFPEIAAARVMMVGPDPNVMFSTAKGKTTRIRSRRLSNDRFRTFISLLHAKIGDRLSDPDIAAVASPTPRRT